MTKYGKKIENRDLNLYIDSLKNKTYKLLPLREEKLQWEKHLETILIEISGFNSITSNQQVKIISVLSKLEALKDLEDFQTYRKTIFESLNILEELKRGE